MKLARTAMPHTRRLVIGIRRRTGVISLLALFSIGSIAVAQPQHPPAPPLEAGTSSITGRVINAQTRQPAAGVEVMLSTFSGGVARSSSVKSDATGVFAFSNIAEGSYLLATSVGDYQMGCYANGEASERCAPISLARDEQRATLDFALTPNAVARGRVVDEHGSPISGATVRLTATMERPGPGGAMVRLSLGRGVTTAQDGAFEVRGVAPGTWQLEAMVPGAKGSMALPLLFYPGVFTRDEATPVEFVAGGVSDTLVFVVPSTESNLLTVHVAPGPLPINDVRAVLLRSSPFVARTIQLDEDGAASIGGVLPGRYFIAARGWIKDRAWAAFEIADFLPPSLDLSLQMKPAGSIRGRIVAQNGGLPPVDGIAVAAGWTHEEVEINPMTPDQAPVEADGSFKIDGLFGKRVVRLIGLSPEWGVYAIRQGRSDVRGSVDVPPETTVDITVVVARR